MRIKKTNYFCFSNDEKYYAVFGKTVKVFDINSGEPIFEITADGKNFSSIDFSADDKYIIAYELSKKQLLVIDIFNRTKRFVSLNSKIEDATYIYALKDTAYIVYGVHDVSKCGVICVDLKDGRTIKEVAFPQEYYIKAVDFSYVNNLFVFACELIPDELKGMKIYENEYLDENKYIDTVTIKLDTDLNEVFKSQRHGCCPFISYCYLSKYDSFISNYYGYMVNIKTFDIKSVIGDDFLVMDKSKNEKLMLCVNNNNVWKLVDTDSFSVNDITGIEEKILYGAVSSNGNYIFLNGEKHGYILKSDLGDI